MYMVTHEKKWNGGHVPGRLNCTHLAKTTVKNETVRNGSTSMLSSALSLLFGRLFCVLGAVLVSLQPLLNRTAISFYWALVLDT